MTSSDYLLISRGQWDETASKEDVQDAIDRFYVWYERGVAEGVLKPGSRLENRGKQVSRNGIIDGPFAETKEMLAGFNLIEADSLDEAVKIAQEFPWIGTGSIEVRPVRDFDAVRRRVGA